jgi:hypothetical protein
MAHIESSVFKQARVAALEETLGGKAPPDRCRFCGERAVRLESPESNREWAWSRRRGDARPRPNRREGASALGPQVSACSMRGPISESELIESVPAANPGIPPVFASELGIFVHRNTSVYISRNEVEPRLGTVMHEY